MKLNPILALGVGNVAMGQFVNVTSPETVGDFNGMGCMESTTGFAKWALISTSDVNSLDLCAASCPSAFFGVSNQDCYCGDSLDSGAVTKLPPTSCSAKCPGNAKQACGGPAAGKVRRQAGSAGALNVYQRAPRPTVTPPTMTSPPKTLTKTITSTTVATITSCPPYVTNCPVGGKTTKVTTVTTTYCPEATSSWHSKTIICYGNWCVPSKPCYGPDCRHHRVICDGDYCYTEECSIEEANKLVLCQGKDCKYANWQGNQCLQKVVCYNGQCSKQKCYGNECQKKLVCKGDHCKYHQCKGADCFQKEVCVQKQCKPQPPCVGPNCPCPPPPTPKPKPNPGCTGSYCPPPPCTGPNCPHPPPPPCTGPNCPNPPPCKGRKCPPPPAPPCNGTYCPPPKTVVVAGSERALPAMGVAVMGVVAGLAFLL